MVRKTHSPRGPMKTAAVGAAFLGMFLATIPIGALAFSNGATVFLNPGGGVSATDGLNITYASGQLQVQRDNSAQLYSDSSLPPSSSMFNQIALAIGDPTNGGTVLLPGNLLSKYSVSSQTANQPANVNIAGWNVTTTQTATAFASVLSGVVGGLTYTVNFDVQYTSPSLAMINNYTAVIPTGNTVQVRLYHLIDSLLGGNDEGPGFYTPATTCADGASFGQMVGVDSSVTQVAEFFQYISGLQWTGYASERYSNVVFSRNSYGPTYMNDLPGTINADPTTDNGFGISWSLGTAPGTYSSVASLTFAPGVPPPCAAASTVLDYTIALWVGFALFLFASLVFFFLSYTRNVKPEGRLTYYLVTVINAITALAYLIMAFGSCTVTAHNNIRPLEWVRYAAWVVVAPITVWILGLLSGAHWVSLIWVSFASILSVGALYAAALTDGFNATWPIFAFGIFCGIPLAVALVFTFRRSAYKVHPEIGKLYDVVGLGSLVLYVGYAINWGVSEGGFITTVAQEIITYTVLDILTKFVFGFVLVWSRESIARYGTFLGHINTGVDFDFPIARSTYTSSGSKYATEPSPAVALGEHRDLALAQLRSATNTPRTSKSG